MSLYILDKQHFAVPDLKLLRSLLMPVLTDLEIANLDIEIELLDDSQIVQLNEKFFSRSRPTNVLSFPLDKESGHLGNVVVSVETVGPETRALGYTLEEGIAYYLIHGILHLLGYEHIDVEPEAASLMEKRQDELFELVLNGSC
jgi:rRNA maturation RNase YbeY